MVQRLMLTALLIVGVIILASFIGSAIASLFSGLRFGG